jgi:1-aminocyclopropane-1-carboxylate deaminase
MGADVRLVKAQFGIGFKESWEQALSDVESGGGKPYAIPAGASDHRLGGLGFANWAREVERQERELGIFFDTVIVCSVTGSTQAGMIRDPRRTDHRGDPPGRPPRGHDHRPRLRGEVDGRHGRHGRERRDRP